MDESLPEEAPEPVLTEYQQANFRSLMKATEELVTKARLDQIAREHKSMGAILDDRVLYKIDEPKKRAKKQQTKTALQLLREAELAREEEEEAQVAAKTAAEEAKKVVPPKGHGDYSMELQVWKEKSGPAVYSQTRRFQYPELQKFKDSMNNELKNQFRKRTVEALIELADTFREDCRILKSEMDLSSIFHPEANAHRVHCIYLMKLYKGIRSDTIEDPVLRLMKAEQEKRVADEKALLLQKQELLRSMEAADFANMTPSQQEAALEAAQEKKRQEEEEAARASTAGSTAPPTVGIASTEAGGSLVGSTETAGGSIDSSVLRGPADGLKINIPANQTPKAGAGNSQKTEPSDATPTGGGGKEGNVTGRHGVKFLRQQSSRSGKLMKSASVQSIPTTTPKGAAVGVPVGSADSFDSQDQDGVGELVPGGFGGREGISGKSVGFGSGEGKTPKGSVKTPKFARSSSAANLSTRGSATSTSSYGFTGTSPTAAAISAAAALAGGPNRGSAATQGSQAQRGRSRLMSGISEDASSLQGSLSNTSSPERVGPEGSHAAEGRRNPQAKMNERLFKKIRTQRLGSSDARGLLTDEAAKFDQAETFTLKKTRDKNNILDNEMSNWMIKSVQKAQIAKTGSGTAMPTAGGLSTSNARAITQISSIVTEFNDSIKRKHASPTKMLPFDEFHDMFKSFSDLQLGAQSPTKAEAGLPSSPHKLGAGGGHGSSNASLMSGGLGSTSGSPARRGRRQTDGGILVGGSHHDSEGSFHHKGEKGERVEATNMLRTLAEMDPGFEAYLKVANNPHNNQSGSLQGSSNNYHDNIDEHGTEDVHSNMNQTLLRNLSHSTANLRTKLNGTVNKKSSLKKLRKVTRLGQSAVHLMTSSGKASKDSRKGFTNMFRDPDVEPDEDGSGARVTIDGKVRILGTDDIMGRLKKYGADDETASQASSANQDERTDGPDSAMNSPSRPFTPLDGAPGSQSSHGTRSNSRRSRRQRQTEREGKGGMLQDDNIAGGEADDQEYVHIPEPPADLGMQDKLLAAWDILLVPAALRFAFMRKYSSDEYCMEMSRAVDVWSENAVLVLAVVECLKIVNRIKLGNCIMPLTQRQVLRSIRTKCPPIIATSSDYFIPPTLGYFDPNNPHQTIPLSAAALQKVESLIDGFFIQKGQPYVRPVSGTSGGGPLAGRPVQPSRRRSSATTTSSSSALSNYMITTLPEAGNVMQLIINEIAMLLKKTIKFAHEEFNDAIPYGNKGCKEWIFNITGIKKKGDGEAEEAGEGQQEDEEE